MYTTLYGDLQGEVRFLTGGIVRDLLRQLNRFDSGTNSIVWMEEDDIKIVLQILISRPSFTTGFFIF